ncbi:IS5 family transposase [Ruminococcus flavefaciens]|uniref:IS5 family transposase n=1 Tax=Ruminococcus flavefaciens TaxID=1265 RepID=UPI00048BCBE6
MYRFEEKQLSFTDFNQPQGLQMNPENRWIKKAEMIPWDTIEKEYAKLFPSRTGMPAKPLRMALGSLLIQKQYHYPDEELVEQIRENPYYQYFIGMPRYEDKIPFVPSLLVEFRKRLSEDVLNEINEMIIEYNAQKSDDDNDGKDGDDSGSNDTDSTSDSSENSGTLILDATCAPQNIKYPQDIELLNETREKLEDMLCRISDEYGFYRPRMYKEKARKDYLALAKCRKRGAKKIRKAIKKQLQYIRRDLGYMDNLIENNSVELSASDAELLNILITVYEQQRYMFKNNTHTVENRIVSISQPYIRPIVRGKAKSPVEFGAKLDLSVDETGMCRLEKLSFDAYNESAVLKTAIENYKQRTGHYPERVLVDQIYRNRENITFCSNLGIRLSGKRLGRPKKYADTKAETKTAYQDNTDRIEVERKFSLAKRKFGLGLLLTKREDTTKELIVLSIIAMNIDRLAALFLRLLKFILSFVIFDDEKVALSENTAY